KRRVIQKLEQELNIFMLHDNSVPDEGEEGYTSSIRGNHLSLLEYFLLRGTLPWWAGQSSDNQSDAMGYLLSHAGQELRLLLLKIGKNEYVRVRLVSQFSEEILKRIIAILEPGEAEFIIGYHTRVLVIQQEQSVVKSEESDFRKAVWVFILTYLLVDK